MTQSDSSSFNFNSEQDAQSLKSLPQPPLEYPLNRNASNSVPTAQKDGDVSAEEKRKRWTDEEILLIFNLLDNLERF